MIDNYFLSVEVFTHHRNGSVFPPLRGVERPLWQGRAGIAEYAFDKPASQPRWALPETTELMVTDHRVLYAHTRSDSPDTREVVSGELRWIWPQHLRVQPGAAQSGRSAATTQVQLVCAGADGTWPALVFAGGDLRTVTDADKLANLVRQAIARFRLDNAAKLGLSTSQGRLLSRLVIGPEFTNYQGGPGQTVSILGALPVQAPVADGSSTASAVSEPAPAVTPGLTAPAAADPAPLAAPDPAPLAASDPAPFATADLASFAISALAPFATLGRASSVAPDSASATRGPASSATPGPASSATPGPASSATPATPGPASSGTSDTAHSVGAGLVPPAASDPARSVAPGLPPAAPDSTPEGAAPVAAEPRTKAKGAHRTSEDSPTVDLRAAARAVGEGPTRVITLRPGVAADAARARQAAEAEATAQRAEPELASRAATIAARVADLVSHPAPLPPGTSPQAPGTPLNTPDTFPQAPGPFPQTSVAFPQTPGASPETPDVYSPATPGSSPGTPVSSPGTPASSPGTPGSSPRHAKETNNQPDHSEDGSTRRMGLSTPDRFEETTNLADRAEALRRTTARMAANSGRHKAAARRAVTIWSDAHSDGIR